MKPSDLQRTGQWTSGDIVFCAAASDDATRCWLGSSDAGVYELDVSAEKPERKRFQGDGHRSYVTGMVRCGDQLVTCSYDKQLIWWDVEKRQQIRSVSSHDKWIRRVVATPDGHRVISVADDMRCRVWDFASGERVADFSDHKERTPHHYPSMLYAVAVSDDGSHIATGDRVGHVAIWNAQSFEKVGEVESPVMYTWDPRRRRHSIGGIRSLAFSPDGNRLAVGGMGEVGNIDHLQGASRLEVFDWKAGQRLHALEDDKKKGLVEEIAWSPRGDWILVVGGDHNGFITIYDADSGKMLHQADHNGHIHSLWHDAQYEHLFLAAHQRLTRWTMS